MKQNIKHNNMKKTIYFLLILIAVMSFSSCSSDDNDTYVDPAENYQKMIIGTWVKDSTRWETPQYGLISWRATENDLTDTLEFHSDGTGIDRSLFYSIYSKTDFRWSVTVSTLSRGNIIYAIMSFQQNKLWLEKYGSGRMQYIYRRIQ